MPDPTPSAPKRRKQRTSWHRSSLIQKDIAVFVMNQYIREILAPGVRSKADLHRQLEKALKASVDRDQLDTWLKHLDLSKIFDQKVVFKLPPVDLPALTGQVFKNAGKLLTDPDDDSDLDEGLPPMMQGNPGASPPASAAFSGADASGGSTHGNNGWTPPPDPLAPATIAGRPATVMPLGGALPSAAD